jgi:class 3 adenylate cyclase
VRCATVITQSLQPFGIVVRSGLHTGEIELMRDDIGGIAVHIAARVTSIAQPGETLVSSTVRDLVAGSGLRFGDRGRAGMPCMVCQRRSIFIRYWSSSEPNTRIWCERLTSGRPRYDSVAG